MNQKQLASKVLQESFLKGRKGVIKIYTFQISNNCIKTIQRTPEEGSDQPNFMTTLFELSFTAVIGWQLLFKLSKT